MDFLFETASNHHATLSVPRNMSSSPTFDLDVGMLTPKYASLYHACTRRLHTQSGAMDHD